MIYDALIESYQAVLGRVSDRCWLCADGKPHDDHEYPDEIVRSEIARLKELQRSVRA